jgi:hypothetical protein
MRSSTRRSRLTPSSSTLPRSQPTTRNWAFHRTPKVSLLSGHDRATTQHVGSQITDYTVAAIKHGDLAIQNGPEIIEYVNDRRKIFSSELTAHQLEKLQPSPSVYPSEGSRTLSTAIYKLFSATALMPMTKSGHRAPR